MNRRSLPPPLASLLWLAVILSLLPAGWLVARRIRAEGTSRQVAIVMDEPALAEQAAYYGLDSFELGLRYRDLGLTGIALYEETLETLEADGRAAVLRGGQARSLAAARGEVPPAVPGDSTLAAALVPGALDALVAKNRPQGLEVELAGLSWFLYPGDGVGTRPAGPDREAVVRWAEAGFDIAYRPRNFPNLVRVGSDFPEEARYLIHAGLQVAGHPSALGELVAASQDYLTAIIEGTEQDGMTAISRKVPTVRLLSFNQDYLNLRLRPPEVIDKYLLGVNERGIRLLYLRPYTEEQLGDMRANTEALVSGLVRALEREGYTVGPLATLDLDYRTNVLLRLLSGLGILAGLGLLVPMYPGAWGPLVAGAVAGLAWFAGGFDWDALALIAALVFPVLGFGHLRERIAGLGLATAITLAGAVLLAAVGSDRESMLAISPFAGVAATLVVPPALYAFHYALRFHRPAAWVKLLWNHPIRLGDVLIAGFALAAVALVILRRGNFPIVGASSAELSLREWLSELFVRPRFKELLGHPLAVLGLTGKFWPAWVRAGLLTGGVVAQASILNSFSHYHTPLLVSFQRSLIALLLGGLLGLVLLPLARLATGLIRRWLDRVPSGEGPSRA